MTFKIRHLYFQNTSVLCMNTSTTKYSRGLYKTNIIVRCPSRPFQNVSYDNQANCLPK